MVFGKLGSLFIRNTSSELRLDILCLHIAFVSDQDKCHFWVAVHLGLFEPSGYILKGLEVGYVVDEDGPGSRPIVASRDGLEGLLPGLGRD